MRLAAPGRSAVINRVRDEHAEALPGDERLRLVGDALGRPLHGGGEGTQLRSFSPHLVCALVGE